MQHQKNPVTAANPDIVARLRRHGINPTAQRIEIAQVMLPEYQHLSADQILQAVNGDRHSVSKATVYNTLKLFAGKGLIREVFVDPNKVFYDTNIHPHYHIYNEDTAELFDLEAGTLEVTGSPVLPENTKQSGIDVVIRVRNR